MRENPGPRLRENPGTTQAVDNIVWEPCDENENGNGADRRLQNKEVTRRSDEKK